MEQSLYIVLHRLTAKQQGKRNTSEGATKTEKKLRTACRGKRRKPTFILLTISREQESRECYDKYLKLNRRVEDKMKLDSYEVEREVERTEKGKVESLVSSRVSGYAITTESKQQSDTLKEISNICNYSFIITSHVFYNSAETLVYVHTYNMCTPEETEFIKAYPNIANTFKPEFINRQSLISAP